MSRREFTGKVKGEAALRANGKCEGCGARLSAGHFHYDHHIPDGIGGEPTLDNCRVLCKACHGIKTRTRDVPMIAKAKRIRARHIGIRRPRTIRAWRRFDGSIVHAPRER